MVVVLGLGLGLEVRLGWNNMLPNRNCLCFLDCLKLRARLSSLLLAHFVGILKVISLLEQYLGNGIVQK